LELPFSEEENGFVFAFERQNDGARDLIVSCCPNARTIWREKSGDWLARYQKSFAPIAVGSFGIRPSWRDRSSSAIDIVIDPEMVFGTGHHETTAACLEALERFDLNQKTLLDVGCGSGILAIAAAKKGAVVSLCDTDENAIRAAKRNCALNGVTFDEAWVGSIIKVNKNYHFTVANIVTDILVAISNDLTNVLRGGGVLIVSGILERLREKAVAAFHHLTPLFEIQKGEWISFAYKKEDRL
jgi:ribosomal protein L11 methyltransferase